MQEEQKDTPLNQPDTKEMEYTITPSFLKEVRSVLDKEEEFDAKNTALLEIIFPLHPADFAELLALLDYEERKEILLILGAEFDAETLTYLDTTLREEILEIIGAKQTAEAINLLESDDAIEVIQDFDHEDRQEILEAIPEERRAEIVERLNYPEHSAGRLMNRNAVAVPEFWNVGDVIDFLRKEENLPEDFYEIFVVNPKFNPIGGIVLSRVMISQRSTLVKDIMKLDIHQIPTDMDQEDVGYIFRKYGLVSAPVVSDTNRLVGVITVDDIVHVIQEEAQEDLMKMGGVHEADLNSDVIKTVGKRFPWLFVNLLTAFTTSLFIGLFEGQIEKLVALAVLMPIVASMGGNAGTQSMTVAIRALATKQLNESNITKLLGREVTSCFLNGLLFGSITGIAVFLRYQDIHLSLVFASALTINFTIAGTIGSLIPYSLYKLKADPAISSGVFLTALTDIGGFIIFLTLAAIFLL